MDVRITLLMDNEKEREELCCEHGFSAYLECGDRRILFDTGSSGRFLDNARLLGLDLSRVSDLVLSHGHWDHACGLPRFVEEGAAPKAALWLHRAFFIPKYSDGRALWRYAGPNFGPEYLRLHSVSTRYVAAPTLRLWEGGPVWLLSGFGRTRPFERVAPVFQLLDGARFVPDGFADELALAVETDGGLVVVSGCSHNGMLTICDAARDRLGRPVRAFLGGTHLIDADERQAAETLAALRDGGPREAFVCHCTGAAGIELLTRGCAGVRHIRAGSVLEF